MAFIADNFDATVQGTLGLEFRAYSGASWDWPTVES